MGQSGPEGGTAGDGEYKIKNSCSNFQPNKELILASRREDTGVEEEGFNSKDDFPSYGIRHRPISRCKLTITIPRRTTEFCRSTLDLNEIYSKAG
jgi:hypothetical protein